jgi:hypothetical protein
MIDKEKLVVYEMQEPKLEDIKLAEDLFGFFKTVSTAPTEVPNSFFNQVQIYTNGSTYRLYWYDYTNGAWHYITATA